MNAQNNCMNGEKIDQYLNSPILSVILPTFNAQLYIVEALESIFMQVCSFQYEVLIGDDASTDGTVGILKDYASKHSCIKLHLRKKNIGASNNCLDLLLKAKGKYLATLEGDDRWSDSNKLQIQVDFLDQNPSYIGCCHKFNIISEEGRALKCKKLNWVKHKIIFSWKDFRGFYLPSQPCTFVRRNIFLDKTKSIFFPNPFHHMVLDRQLMVLFLSSGKFYSFNKRMSDYRLTKQSLTNRIYKERLNNISEINYNKQLEEYGSTLFNKKIIFKTRRLMLMTNSIMDRDKIGMKELLHDKETSSLIYLLIPFYIVRKAIYKIFRLETYVENQRSKT